MQHEIGFDYHLNYAEESDILQVFKCIHFAMSDSTETVLPSKIRNDLKLPLDDLSPYVTYDGRFCA